MCVCVIKYVVINVWLQPDNKIKVLGFYLAGVFISTVFTEFIFAVVFISLCLS